MLAPAEESRKTDYLPDDSVYPIEIVAYGDMLIIQKVWQKILEIFFPAVCISCSAYLRPEENEKMLCGKCFNTIEIPKETPGAQLHAVGLYSSKPLRDLIHALKFKRYTRAMNQIEELIDKYTKKDPSSILKTCDLITFIPLHSKRQKNRGFNQAELIAKILGDKLNIQVETTLRRVRDTKKQSLIKDPHKRLENVRRCFVIKDINTLQGKSIILVDDVYTSGATALEAMKVLREAGAGAVTIFVLAKT